MARLPIPGSDENTWGNVLNDFLTQSLNTDGTIKSSAISGAIGDASATDKGVVRLTGDLGGTAASPTVPGLTVHINDSSAAHAASAVSFQATGSIAGTDVQTAVAEVATDAAGALVAHNSATTSVHGIADTSALETTAGAQAKVDTHVNDNSSAHAASAISFSTGGTIAGTDVQTAVAEVATDAADALNTHEADVVLHASGREVDYAEVTSNQSFTANAFQLSDVTGLDVTIPPGGTRPVYIRTVVHLVSTTAGAQAVVGIVPSTATTGAENFAQAIAAGYASITTASRPHTLVAEARISAGTSGTWKVCVTTSAGTSNTVTSSSGPFIACFVKAVEA